MSYVYRRPFQTAQHRVARVEWQPQPLWAFDGVTEEWVLTEYTGTIGYYSGAPATFTGIADAFILTENIGAVGAETALAPTITTLEPAGGAVNVAYTFTFQATGDVPITWDVSVGSVPAGLTLASTGVLSGTPSGTGTTAFTVRATNAQGTDTLACSLVVGTAATGTGSDRAAHSRPGGRGLLRLVGR